MKLPHPIPYQGSKRNLADKILTYFPKTIDRLIEPFAGSAAITVAAAYHGKTTQFIINDVNEPLVKLWDKILNFPEATINEYQLILSYDGRTGEKQFGKPLPDFLALSKIEIDAGRSSIATLLNRVENTFESLYISPSLLCKITLN